MNTVSSYPSPAPTARRFRISSSIVVYLGLIGYMLLVKTVILPLLPDMQMDFVTDQFSWSFITIVGSLGLAGVWLAERTGFMPAFDARVSNRQRFLIPFLAGSGIGVAASIIDTVTKGSAFIANQEGVASFNADFPASLFLYTGYSILIDAVFRLFLFPVLLGLISYIVLRKRWQEQVFWVLAILLSALEPLGQLSGRMSEPIDNFGVFFVTIFLPSFATQYALALVQVVIFRKYGFLASFMTRIGYYFTWHIVYASLVLPYLLS